MMNFDIEPIVVYTPYTLEQMRALLRYNTRIQRKAIEVFAAIVFLSSVVSLINNSPHFIGVYEVVTVVFLIVVWLYCYGLFYTRGKHEAVCMFFRNGQTLSFRSSGYSSDSHSEDAQSKFTISYSTITAVRETKTMFYLYAANKTFTLIDKNGFQNGSAVDLRELFRLNVAAKKCRFLKK